VLVSKERREKMIYIPIWLLIVICLFALVGVICTTIKIINLIRIARIWGKIE